MRVLRHVLLGCRFVGNGTAFRIPDDGSQGTSWEGQHIETGRSDLNIMRN